MRRIFYIFIFIFSMLTILNFINKGLWKDLVLSISINFILISIAIAIFLFSLFFFIKVFQLRYSPWTIFLIIISLIVLFYVLLSLFGFNYPNKFFQDLFSIVPGLNIKWISIFGLFITVSIITTLLIAPLNFDLLIKAIIIGICFFIIYLIIMSFFKMEQNLVL